MSEFLAQLSDSHLLKDFIPSSVYFGITVAGSVIIVLS